MQSHELRDAADARRFLLQGLWLQRAGAPRAGTVPTALGWLQELAGAGEPVPPIGFVADVGALAWGQVRELGAAREAASVPGWPAGLARAYEDQVLGKIDADWTFARASDALARYRGRDRARGLAFLLDQFRGRAGFGGVLINPATLKATQETPPEALLAEGWDALERDGPIPLLFELYSGLIAAVRDAPEVLGPEDVFELEHGTALAAFGQRVALRQVLRSAAELEAAVGRARPRPRARKEEVPTRMLDEDAYPVGGFASISTRGSVESLLHSQLAYMEPSGRPDLFDIKFLRDELLYYSRDENQFLRRRRTFLLVLDADLVQARVKDPELPRQRIVLLMGLLVAAVRTLTEWHSEDALRFEFLFPGPDDPLAEERALAEMIFREAIANGTVTTETIPTAQIGGLYESRSRRSLCHVLAVSAGGVRVEVDPRALARVRVHGPRPQVAAGDEPFLDPDADDAPDAWRAALAWLLPLGV